MFIYILIQFLFISGKGELGNSMSKITIFARIFVVVGATGANQMSPLVLILPGGQYPVEIFEE